VAYGKLSSVCDGGGRGGPLRGRLKRCYEAALVRSETINDLGGVIRQARAQYGQTLGSALPEFYFWV